MTMVIPANANSYGVQEFWEAGGKFCAGAGRTGEQAGEVQPVLCREAEGPGDDQYSSLKTIIGCVASLN